VRRAKFQIIERVRMVSVVRDLRVEKKVASPKARRGRTSIKKRLPKPAEITPFQEPTKKR